MISLGIQFKDGAVSTVSVAQIGVAITFPQVTVINPTGSDSLDFFTTSAQSYTFDGTVTGYNPNGLDLRGKSIRAFWLDGLLVTKLNSEYEFTTLTGELEIKKDIVTAMYCYLEYQ